MVGRMSALYSNLPVSAGFLTVNRACASGLQAVIGIAEGVMLGRIGEVRLVGGGGGEYDEVLWK